MIKLYNTLSRKEEIFKSSDDKIVKLYTCGPTVYDSAHIGNFKTYIFEDILRRTLEYSGFKVEQVMNITDVDDKTIRKSEGHEADFKKLTAEYEAAFFEDLKKLNVELPSSTPRATEYIEKMVAFIKDLLDKGVAYKATDGSIYFSIDKFPGYGQLSGLDKEGLKVGARVKQDEYAKDNPADFALWKAYDPTDGEIFWDPSTWLGAGTALGKGRPGWHIECSAMSQDKLGDTLDIHAGGIDLIFPHHENEIAQSEARTGKQFARFWIHGEHLLVDGQKMSKSLNNFYTLSDIEKHGFSPLDFRYFVLMAHYRSKLNFTWESLKAAKNGLKNLRQNVERLKDFPNIDDKEIDSAGKQFIEAIDHDLNTPIALSVLQDLISKAQSSQTGGEQVIKLIEKFDQVLALDLNVDNKIPEDIKALAEKRAAAKKAGDFASADRIRIEISQKGYQIEDTGAGHNLIKN